MTSAGVAATVRIWRVIVLGIARISYVQTPLAGEQLSVPRVTSGKHAIEHVDPSCHALDEVLRRPRAHEVSRLCFRKSPCRLPHNLVHEVDRLANAQAPDRVALEPNRGRRVGALTTEIREHAALNDAELRLAGVAHDKVGRGSGAEELDPRATARLSLIHISEPTRL